MLSPDWKKVEIFLQPPAASPVLLLSRFGGIEPSPSHHVRCAVNRWALIGVHSLFPAMSDTDTVEVPIVSGVSPKEGPPGTKLTIRGEHLGDSKKDILGEAWAWHHRENSLYALHVGKKT